MDLVMKSVPLRAPEGTQRNLAPLLTCRKTTGGYQAVTMPFSYKAEVGGSRPSAPTARTLTRVPARDQWRPGQ